MSEFKRERGFERKKADVGNNTQSPTGSNHFSRKSEARISQKTQETTCVLIMTYDKSFETALRMLPNWVKTPIREKVVIYNGDFQNDAGEVKVIIQKKQRVRLNYAGLLRQYTMLTWLLYFVS